jgi:aspartyl-tRNA synthetase
MTPKRTHWCGELRPSHVGEQVTLTGWCHRIRDLGGLFFVDLRDRSGICQLNFEVPRFPRLGDLRPEYLLAVRGEVVARDPKDVNPKIPTGEVEIHVSDYEVLNPSEVLPFPLSDEAQMERVPEELRVKYRYLDLRRPSMQKRLQIRARCVSLIRQYLDERGFLEVETPHLTRSTPEGARDYLVPYRLSPGKFYALPQSPQQYKQLLMVAGLERYYQIARCFRDEAQRADRQPEFTQLDLEMSFVDREDILELAEGLTRFVCNRIIEEFQLDFEPVAPFPRLSYPDAMRRFGTDKPDLRFGLEIFDITDIAGNCSFQIFSHAVQAGNTVRGIVYPQGGGLSRKQISALEDIARAFGAKGLASMPVTAPEEPKEIGKHFSKEQISLLYERSGAQKGDRLFFVADTEEVALNVLGRLRVHIGTECSLRDPRKLCFCWVLDFPLFLWDAETQKWEPAHHPFCMPVEEDLPFLEQEPGKVRAQSYDIVCNGSEWASGSIRIHRADIQEKVFRVMGLTEEDQKRRFGHMLTAFQYGAPPHGGIAPGIDRLVMYLTKEENIREVIAFPKIAGGYDPMMDTPSDIEPEQWEELGLQVRPQE